MRHLDAVAEDELVAVFLRGESDSPGFGATLPDPFSGRGLDRNVFKRFPTGARWLRAAATPADLARVRHIAFESWIARSGGSRLSADAVVRIGREINVRGNDIPAGITPAWNGGATPPAELPLVSMILTTRDRPDFFPIALACCHHQTYPHRELIVVDDGDRYPVDAALVAAEGGRLIRTEPGTPIGTKLNSGIDAADGYVCLVIDDDDWYGPGYIATMVARILDDWRDASRASMAGAAPYLIFDLARWVIVRTAANHVGGGSLCFRREDWAAGAFRPIDRPVDRHFLADQASLGTRLLKVAAPEDFLGIRHHGAGNNRGHTWDDAERYLARLRTYHLAPEALLPPWVLTIYRRLRDDYLLGW